MRADLGHQMLGQHAKFFHGPSIIESSKLQTLFDGHFTCRFGRSIFISTVWKSTVILLGCFAMRFPFKAN